MDAGKDVGRDSSVPMASLLAASIVATFLAMTRALFGEEIVLVTVFYLLTMTSLVVAYDSGEGDPSTAIFQLLCAIGTIILICLAPIGLAARVILLLSGVLVALFVFYRKGLRVHSLVAAIGAGATLAASLFFIVNGKYYANVFVPDSILFGLVHTDTLYHSAIAGIFASFGVPSTGLDGIPLTRYHTLSNMLLGLLAKGAEVPTPTGYFLGMQIVLLPLLYFALSAATASASKATSGAHGGVSSFVVPAALLGVFGMVDFSSYLVSESHALALALLLLGCIVLRQVSRGQPLTWTTLAITCSIALLATATKVSVGAVFLCGMSVAFLLTRSLRPAQWAALALFLTVLAALLLTLFLPASHGAQSRIMPFAFALEYPVVALINLAIIVLGVIIGVMQVLSKPGDIWPKVLLIMLLASVAPAMLLQVDGGSAYYFLNIGTWLAMVEIAALIVNRFDDRRLIASSVVILMLSGLTTALVQQVPARFRDYIETFYARSPKPDDAPAQLSLWEQLHAYQQYRSNLPMAVLATAIAKAKVDDHSLVLLPDNVWRELPYTCTDAPFAIPAYLGLPMLMGLRTVSRNCSFGPHYSFKDYDQSPPAAESLTEDEICFAARKRGFEHVLRARSVSEVDNIACTQR